MTSAIVSRLFPDDRAVDWAADIGCGTGLFTRDLVGYAKRVVCVDPSAGMLAQLPEDPALLPVQASVEDVVGGRITLPHNVFDAVLVKEAIHHVHEADRAAVLTGLGGMLGPSGRLLVVMLPARIDYPLFPAALRLFEQLQPEPEVIAAAVRDAGLAVELSYESFALSFPRERYLQMVRNRYMSLLSEFDDAALEAGIAQMDTSREVYEFADRFAFITGTAG
ncbi:class I SAM-dependent methyltransferase [Nocardia transvalensis]|nr:class I SAM-dependent methyltransferase [Nocardia transvalensis]